MNTSDNVHQLHGEITPGKSFDYFCFVLRTLGNLHRRRLCWSQTEKEGILFFIQSAMFSIWLLAVEF